MSDQSILNREQQQLSNIRLVKDGVRRDLAIFGYLGVNDN